MATALTTEELRALGASLGVDPVNISGSYKDFLESNQELDSAKDAIPDGWTIDTLGLDPIIAALFPTGGGSQVGEANDNFSASLSNFGIGGEDSFYEDPGPYLRGETDVVPRGFTTNTAFSETSSSDTPGTLGKTEGDLIRSELVEGGATDRAVLPLQDPRFRLAAPSDSNLAAYIILGIATLGIGYGVISTAAAASALAGATALETAVAVTPELTSAFSFGTGTSISGTAGGLIGTTGVTATGGTAIGSGLGTLTGGLSTGLGTGLSTGLSAGLGGTTSGGLLGTGAAPALPGGGLTSGLTSGGGALATAGSTLLGGVIDAGINLGANALFGGAGKAGNLAETAIGESGPLNISAPGFTSTIEGDELSLIRSPRLEGLLTDFQSAGDLGTGRLEGQLGLVEPGFGKLSQSTRDVFADARQRLADQRRADVGNLKSNLERRSVLGSSFGDDTLTRRGLEFDQAQTELANQESLQLAQNNIQELEASVQLINNIQQNTQATTAAVLQQFNIESEAAIQIADSVQKAASIQAALLTQLAILNAQGSGAAAAGLVDAIGEPLGDLIGTGLETLGKTIFGANA